MFGEADNLGGESVDVVNVHLGDILTHGILESLGDLGGDFKTNGRSAR